MPFRTEHVASLLRPEALKLAHAQAVKGENSADQLTAIEAQEILVAAEKQDALGLQAVTDGEVRRSWWHFGI